RTTMAEETTALGEPSLAELAHKLDRLTAQVEFLTEEAIRQQRRQQEWDELMADLGIVSKEVFQLLSAQLEEMEPYVRLENVLRLLKRLLRDTCLLEQLLEQLESAMDFWQDFSPLTREVVLTLTNRLDEMERKGYFAFMRTVLEAFEEIVGSFSREELEQLRRNIRPLVATLKEFTRPETQHVLQRTLSALQEDGTGDASLFGLLRQLNQPATRRGLARTLHLLAVLGER
ncbi:MAG: hypothetical protein NZ765_01460, partial [Anaerolineae bacterium]|nr:hypothetical protein [Anaerolineae bacterium]MDW8070712.1 hypothetical protein [Anaerolineae bacterium]